MAVASGGKQPHFGITPNATDRASKSFGTTTRAGRRPDDDGTADSIDGRSELR